MYQKESIETMRIDSCRKCGNTLEVNRKCHICNKANEFFCHNCRDVTIEQIHSHTFLGIN
jgi:hypothetical protein